MISSQLLIFLLLTSFTFIDNSPLISHFNITLTTPGNASNPTTTPHKSIHVKYSLPPDSVHWSLIGFHPLLQFHHKAVQRITVILCRSVLISSLWFDDQSECDQRQSMLIYHWDSYSSLDPFYFADNCALPLNQTKSIILSVYYRKEKRIHKEQSGIHLHLSNRSRAEYFIGTMIIGNKRGETRFSCRSENHPRLLYGLQRISFNNHFHGWWRIHTIRIRQFGRKLVETVHDSSITNQINRSEIEIVSPDLFFTRGDYLTAECQNDPRVVCQFLVYYTYRSMLENKNDQVCEENNYPEMFKLISQKFDSNNKRSNDFLSRLDGWTMFQFVLLLLFVLWISTIAGCVVMRRIKGLVNYRTQPVIPSSLDKNKRVMRGRTGGHDMYHRGADADHVMQIDGEHAGLI